MKEQLIHFLLPFLPPFLSAAMQLAANVIGTAWGIRLIGGGKK
jgi:hypothetical protein